MTARQERRRAQRDAATPANAAMLAQHDTLLTVLNAILLAYGEGPDKRLAIANAYYNGHQRREVDIINHGDRIIVRLVPLPVTEEEPDAEAEG